MDISIIIPLYNEEESIPHLVSWIEKVVTEHGYSYEIIMVNDGSSDLSWEIIENCAAKNKNIKGISFRRNYGKSAALYCGFEASHGDVVITMDADLQDSPDEIPELYRMIVEEKYDLVSGWKKKRYDSKLTKNLPSKLYNATARKISGVKLHDMNCGLKAYRRNVVKSIEVYGEMHRYIPIIAKWAGFYNIGEKVVEHRARQYGTTKFGLSRFIYGYLDLLSIMFISKFGKSPMHLFGAVGSLMFFLGFASTVWLGLYKIYCLSSGIPAILVTDNPYFYIALTAMMLGTQLFLAGFLGELISRNSTERNKYLINRTVGIEKMDVKNKHTYI
ncbi:MAG: glycosyltransferase family 2 protein [Prevotellaceae bacterium]|jgi:glycosyltransferase involved in cell wall biosynthesis|nr:glycosyltransferase family 2 protein [Prevotellaceae bacterium]